MANHLMTRNRTRLALTVSLTLLAATAGAPLAAQAQPPAQAPTSVQAQTPAQAQSPARAESLDEILKAVSTYNGGIESEALWKLRDYVLARRDNPAERAECETKLLQFLKTPATPLAKMAACKYLREIASDKAVPALSALLLNERTIDMALYALQQIPGRAVDDALVQALSKTIGPSKLAVIGALGQRGSADAVPALAPLLQQPATAMTSAIALGAIGNDAAADALLAANTGAQAELRATIASALMRCAERRLAAGNGTGALELYEKVSADSALPVPVRKAAALGRISAAGSRAPAVLLSQLGTPTRRCRTRPSSRSRLSARRMVSLRSPPCCRACRRNPR